MLGKEFAHENLCHTQYLTTNFLWFKKMLDESDTIVTPQWFSEVTKLKIMKCPLLGRCSARGHHQFTGKAWLAKQGEHIIQFFEK